MFSYLLNNIIINLHLIKIINKKLFKKNKVTFIYYHYTILRIVEKKSIKTNHFFTIKNAYILKGYCSINLSLLVREYTNLY